PRHISPGASAAAVTGRRSALSATVFLEWRPGAPTTPPAGKPLPRHARLLLQQAEHLQQDLAEYAQGIKGQVRLLCNTTALSEYLPELLADFLRQHPNLDIDLQELPSLRITQALRQGTADLGIISDAVDTHGLQTLPFRDDPLVLIMPLDHPLATANFIDSLQYDYVGLTASSALSVYLEEQALHAGFRLQTRIRAEGFDGLIRMVAGGAGLGIVPQAALERWPTEKRIKAQPLSEDWACRKLLLCARSFEQLPGYAKALFDALALPLRKNP
ncbi:LysR family transcriptional regulator, partial [Pseudomonas sp. PA-5-4G]|uniref:LysR substrate-binding domain-containing protein n=1 Tax=Pseudomonas sp. PA-5-4G TaxID=2665479 RepID=UPI001F174604